MSSPAAVVPRVAVLLASYNGEQWLMEQVNSLLAQEKVEVTVFVSDDVSSDRTLALLRELDSPRIVILDSVGRMGSAARNFFRLMRDVDFSGFDAVSLSDQDDIWYPFKLARALQLMHSEEVAAVSSNVEAFWPDGRRHLIVKSQPQRLWDHFFEAAGPGCTYVFRADLAEVLKQHLVEQGEAMQAVSLHDWFFYCYARSHGYRWHIDDLATMAYRQHASNVLGANNGLPAAKARWAKIQDGWYRQQTVLIATLCGVQDKPPVVWLGSGRKLHVLLLLLSCAQLRRRWRDRCLLAVTFLFQPSARV